MPLFYHAGALGDFLLGLPFLRAARAARPEGPWTLAAPEPHAELAARIFPHERRVAPGGLELAPLTARELDPEQLGRVAERWRGLYGFLPRPREIEDAIERSRPGLPSVLEQPLGLAAAEGVEIEALLRDAIGRLGLPRRGLEPVDFALARSELPELPRTSPYRAGPLRHPGGKLAILHPGASDPAKMAPAALFERIRARLLSEGWSVVAARGPVERERGDPLPSGDVLDDPPILVLAHTIAEADLYVGNDTGPTHLASALGVRTVALHRTLNTAFRPRGARARVVCWAPSSCGDPSALEPSALACVLEHAAGS